MQVAVVLKGFAYRRGGWKLVRTYYWEGFHVKEIPKCLRIRQQFAIPKCLRIRQRGPLKHLPKAGDWFEFSVQFGSSLVASFSSVLFSASFFFLLLSVFLFNLTKTLSVESACLFSHPLSSIGEYIFQVLFLTFLLLDYDQLRYLKTRHCKTSNWKQHR